MGGFPGTGKRIVGEDQPAHMKGPPVPSHLTRLLDEQFEHLERHHPRHRILDRWADDPALAGRTPHDVVALCAESTLEQNPVVSALLRRHQSGDPDAGTVLLRALRPMLKAVVEFRYPKITDDLIDNYWSAASHLIGATDPDLEPVERDGTPMPFITHLGNRLHQHTRDLDPAARRWRERCRRGDNAIPLDVTRRSHEIADHDTRQTATTVEDAAIARLELTQVADAVRNGGIAADRWRQLVEHRLGATVAPATGAERVAVHRTATRLAGLIGHAA